MKFNKETASEAGKKSSRKGIPNKTTTEIREGFQILIENNLDKMEDWLNRIAEQNPLKALEIIHKFGEYIVPKLSRTEVNDVSSLEELLKMSVEDRRKRIIEIKNELNKNDLIQEKWKNQKS